MRKVGYLDFLFRHFFDTLAAAAGVKRVDASILDLYELSAHPAKTPLKDWDFDLLESHFESSALEGLSMQRVAVPHARAGVTLADLRKNPSGRWTLVRVAPTKMKRVVQVDCASLLFFSLTLFVAPLSR